MKSQTQLLVFACVCLLLQSCAMLKNDAKIHDPFSGLEGVWVNLENDAETYHTETWIKTSDSTYVGYGVLLKSGDTTFKENLRIQKLDTSWFYVAEVSENPAPVFFEINELKAGDFRAVNPIHDFPKEIHYTFDKKSLKATVSDGKDDKVSFTFSRKK